MTIPTTEQEDLGADSTGRSGSPQGRPTEKAAELVRKLYSADFEMPYSINLIALVDGVSTYRLRVEGEEPTEHPGYEEASEHLRAIRAKLRIAAAMEFLEQPRWADGDLAAIRALIPTNINLNNPNLGDDVVIPCDVTLGELRAASAAIAKTLPADGAERHGTAAVSSGPTPQSLKAQP